MKRILVLSSLAACAAFAPAQLFNRVEIKTTNPNWFYQEFIPSTTIRSSLVTSGNGTYNPGTGLNFTGLDAVYQVWWFYRGAGDPREYGLSIFDEGMNAGNTASYKFTEPSEGGGNVFEFKFDYTLVAINDDQAYLRIDWRVRNRTAQSRVCNFFSWNDLQIGTDSAANYVAVDGPGLTFSSLLSDDTVTLTTAGTVPTHRESGVYTALRSKLMDSAKQDLSDTFNTDMRDHAAALQYTLPLAAGETKRGTIFRGYNYFPALVTAAATFSNWSSTPGGTPIRVQLMAPGTTTVLETQTVVLKDGEFELVTAQRGLVDVVVKGRATLTRRISGLNLTHNGLSGLSVALLSGDIDGDNTVSVFDYDRLSASFDKTAADSDWLTPDGDGIRPVDADLDNDGSVTVFDYDILSQNFDLVGE